MFEKIQPLANTYDDNIIELVLFARFNDNAVFPDAVEPIIAISFINVIEPFLAIIN